MKLSTKVAALATTAAVSGVAGIAFAAWNSTVNGTGSAASRTHDAGTGDLTAVTPVTADDLYPGATKSAYVSIKNDNPYPVIVTKIYSGSSRESTGGCVVGSVRTDEAANAAGITRNDAATATIAGNVLAPNETGKYQLTVRMSNGAADNCKSQSFEIGDGANAANAMHADVVSAATANSF